MCPAPLIYNLYMITKITRKEFILFMSVLILCAAALLIIRNQSHKKDMGAIRITVDGEVLGEYPLNRDRTIRIGTTNICRIQGGQAIMSHAECPDHLCMRIFDPIDKNGGMIICLPNKVVIEGIPAADAKAGAIDALSG